MNQVILKARAMAAYKQSVSQMGGTFSENQINEFANVIVELKAELQVEGADTTYINELILKLS